MVRRSYFWPVKSRRDTVGFRVCPASHDLVDSDKDCKRDTYRLEVEERREGITDQSGLGNPTKLASLCLSVFEHSDQDRNITHALSLRSLDSRVQGS